MGGDTKIAEYFSEEDLQAITDATTEAESKTCAEIRVQIVPTTNGAIPREFAEQQFIGHGLTNTAERTGVLLLVALEERKIEIVADTGIDAKVSQEAWDKMVLLLSDRFRGGTQVDGIKEVLGRIAEVCNTHFPIKDGDKDELPNTPITE